MLAVGALLGAAAVALGWRFLGSARLVDGPIVLISIDTLRADHLPVYGYRRGSTPAIDALAADGVVFERAYSHSPQTLPAHASILSGILPLQHGVRDNVGFAVKPGQRLLSHMLRDRGFSTAAVVSADVLRQETGIGQGFDFFDGQMPPAPASASADEVQRDGVESLAVAEGWIDTQRSTRVFLFLHLYEPHARYTPPERYGQYAPYDGEIAYADELVGQLAASLRRRGLYEDAAIILLSDHGEGLGDHGETEHGLFLYDETLRVPLIVKLPNQRGAGRRVSQPVQHIDLVPTVLDLISAPPPRGLDGRSLRPLLEGRADWTERRIYSEALYGRYHFGWSELFSLTDARYRFIRAPREELYDLMGDPRERRNIAAEREQTRNAMRASLDRLVEGSSVDAPQLVSPETRQRLAALGYIGFEPPVSADTRGESLPDPKDKINVLEAYRRALTLTGEGKLSAAVDVLQKILADNPKTTHLWMELGTLLMRVGRGNEALRAYRQVARLAPDRPIGLLAVATVLLKQRRLGEAQAQAEAAVAIAAGGDRRDRTAAHELLARIALARNDAATARREARHADEANPSLPFTAYVEGRLLYAAGRYADALDFFQQAHRALASRTQQIGELHLYTGDTLAHLGRFAEAEQAFKQELRLSPHSAWVYASLANLYHSQGRHEEAAVVMDELLKAAPSPEAYALAVQLAEKFGQPDRARTARALARSSVSEDGSKRPN